MDTQTANIVWLKRDLRSQDHWPICQALESDHPMILVYLFEPSLINKSDTSPRHLKFQYASLQELKDKLSRFNIPILSCYGEAVDVFTWLIQQVQIQHVFSYQESGTLDTWKRDKAVAKCLKSHNIIWTEFQRDGIIRGIKNRVGWDKAWHAMITKPLGPMAYKAQKCIELDNEFTLPKLFEEDLNQYAEEWQPAGENMAWKYLASFCEDRGKHYSKFISKPAQSRLSCARLSPFLAWGNISVRQVFHYVKLHKHYPRYKRSFNSMLMRLKWRCHFIQKFEVQCSYEQYCINPGFEKLERSNSEDFIKAWEEGKTGFPMVDACMRCLQTTGWINFRMRAMLVSIICHHLDVDWRKCSYHLARLFLDYEPGIHYPQIQMQAGTTGVNTIRMYNPIKQSMDHDPKGEFIKQWIPELRQVPDEHIHQPWKMSSMEQQLYQIKIGEDYPKPIIVLESAGKVARDKIWGHRKTKAVRQERKAILVKHTRNDRSRRE